MLFTKSLEVTKLPGKYTFCVVNYEYFDNHSEFSKKDLSVPRQSCSDGIARKSPHVAMHKLMQKLKTKASYNSLCV